MPEPTAAMKRKMTQLQKRANAVAEGTAEAQDAPEIVSLSVMLGDGNVVTIGGKEYEVSSFPVAKLGKAGKLLAECPDMMVSAAMNATESGEVSPAKTAEKMNRLMGQADPGAAQVSADAMEFAFRNMALGVTEEEAAAMTPLTVLALSRKHPDLTAEDIEDDLDIEAFLQVLCHIFALNQGLRKRF